MAKDHYLKTCAFHASFFMSHELKMMFVQVIIECVLGLLFGIAGASLKAPPLKEITWASEMQKRYDPTLYYVPSPYSSTRSIDEMDARLGFASYVNRGKSIFSRPISDTE